MPILAIEFKHGRNHYRRTADGKWFVKVLNFFGTASSGKPPNWQWAAIDANSVPEAILKEAS